MNRIVNLLLPTACAACGRLGPTVCSTCRAKFQPIDGPICIRCGSKQGNIVISCVFCRTNNYKLEQSRSCFAYLDPLKTIIQKLKYNGLYSLARPLGREMICRWPEWVQSHDVIVPVPLHHRRRRARGFNQSLLLAQQLAPEVGIELDERALKRVRHTLPQVELSPKERMKNVQNAFVADPHAVKGKNVLLLDDVFTTGSTMNSAANSLREAGANTVSAYCLARAV